MGETVLRQDRGGMATLTINRPDKLNSLNVEVFQDLNAHLEALEQQTDDIGCVVLRGAGRCFSAGHDLGDIAKGERLPRANFQSHVIERLANLPQPVITAVHSHCYTGALELALAGDVILASANAKFADTHAKWALTPVWGMSQRLPRRVGQSQAMEMMLSCRTVGAQEALSLGLVNRCFADEDFFDAVDTYAQQVLAHSWFSHRANKKLLVHTDGLPLGAGLAHEVYRHEGVGPDVHARTDSFLQKKSSKS
jgi:enoyl-CoA hydratase/carnithine racemase